MHERLGGGDGIGAHVNGRAISASEELWTGGGEEEVVVTAVEPEVVIVLDDLGDELEAGLAMWDRDPSVEVSAAALRPVARVAPDRTIDRLHLSLLCRGAADRTDAEDRVERGDREVGAVHVLDIDEHVHLVARA